MLLYTPHSYYNFMNYKYARDYDYFDSASIECKFKLENKEINDFTNKLIEILSNYKEINYLALPEGFYDCQMILPDNIDTLKIHSVYIHSLKNLPKNLKHLKLFDVTIDKLDDVPENLETLELQNIHIDVIDNLPSGIKHFYFNSDFEGQINNLPPNLNHFGLPHNYIEVKINYPDKMKIISVNNGYYGDINLPDDVETLNIYGDINTKIENLPKNLEILSLQNYNYPLDNLPENLEELHINEYNLPMDKLPKNLKVLNIGQFKYNLDCLPNNLERLFIECCDVLLDNLPLNLEFLKIDYCEQEQKFLPNNLKKLHFLSYNFPLDNLPTQLEEIRLPFNYIAENDKGIELFPNTIKDIQIPKYFLGQEELLNQIEEKYGNSCVVTIVEDELEDFEDEPWDGNFD